MTGNWQRLADYVISRRTLRYSSQEALAEAAGVATKTVGRLERGESVSNATLGKIEFALGWTPGSMRTILTGGEPAVAEPDQSNETLDLARATFNEWRREYGRKRALRMITEVLAETRESWGDPEGANEGDSDRGAG